jgi:c-di-GMP-related signal transduction protein
MMILGEACSPAGEAKPPSGMGQPSRFLARQPILNIRRELIGFELLFRAGWENCFSGEADQATRKMMDHCFYVGIDSLVGGGLAFINCTREALVNRLVTLLPPRNTVLEILETVEPDAEVIQACQELRKSGYRIALDDFVPRPEMQPLVDIADYVKVDLRLCDAAARREIHAMTRRSRAALLAEKVESQDEFEITRKEGYEYFQGYFFCRPKVIGSREIPSNKMNYLRLLVELTKKPLDIREVLRIVRLEASLCYRLLRLANSPVWGLREEVTSVRGALMLVGEDRFRMLVSVAASSALGQGGSTALIFLSLERARFCEHVAPLIGENPTEQFMIGLLSPLDAMLEIPMETIVNSLPLRSDVKAALLGERNHASLPLRTILSYETADSTAVTRSDLPEIGEEKLTKLYLESVKWAMDTVDASR